MEKVRKKRGEEPVKVDLFKKFQDELDFVRSKDFVIGKYLYMGMAYVSGHKQCISVGYKIDYAIKKAVEFMSHCGEVFLYKIRKIEVGKTVSCDSFDVIIPTYIRTHDMPLDEAKPAIFDITCNKFFTECRDKVISDAKIAQIISPEMILGKNSKGVCKIKKN